MNTNLAIPNRLNLCVIMAQAMAIAACFEASRHGMGGWVTMGIAVVFGALMNSVYSSIHEAEHSMLFSNPLCNDLAGVVLSLFFPAPFHLIRQGHLGHHLRNRSDDEAFDYYFEGDSKIWRNLVFYGILTGFFYLVVALGNLVFLFPGVGGRRALNVDQPSAAVLDSLNPRYNMLIRLEGAAAIALHAGLVRGLEIPPARYLVMYAVFGLMWSAMQYVHHYGTERHVTRGARNLRLWKPVDLLLLNHNRHLTHHMHPSVPWVHLPRIPVEEAEPPGFLPAAYLKMWRGPKLAPERVRNPHAGKVIP